MSSAQTTKRRAEQGGRTDVHLLPNVDLAVVKCRDPERCECGKWPTGHNAGNLPEKPLRKLLICEVCGKGRRAAVEIVDPMTEEPKLHCQTCAKRAALAYVFKRQAPTARRVHADDASMEFVAVLG